MSGEPIEPGMVPLVFDWSTMRKCGVCGAKTGEPCIARSSTIADGRADESVYVLPRPHSLRLPRKGK